MATAGDVMAAVSAGGGVDGTDEKPVWVAGRLPFRPDWVDPLVEEVKEEVGPSEEHVGDDLEQGERGMDVTYSPSRPYAMAVVLVILGRRVGEGRGRAFVPAGDGGGGHGRAGSPLVGGSSRTSACVVVVAMTLIPSTAARHRWAVGVSRPRWAAALACGSCVSLAPPPYERGSGRI